MTMDLERYTSVAPLQEEWDALADRAGASPFLRPGWIGAWWGAFGVGRLEVLALRREGRLAAVLPVVHRAGGIHSPTNWHTPEYDVVGEDEDAARALIDELLKSKPPYIVLRFVGSGAATIRETAGTRRFRMTSRPLQQSPYVALNGEAPSPGTKREKGLAQAERKLGAEGAVSLDVRDGRESLDELLAEGFRLEGSGWKDQAGTAIRSQPSTLRFYTEVAAWAAGRGELRLFFLRAGERGVAFEFMLCDGRRLYDLKGGYDAELRKLSPGLLIAKHVIGWAREQGLESFEFLGAPEPFKLDWTDRLRDRVALEGFSSRPAGLAARIAFEQGRPLATRLKRAAARGVRHT
jgi:CelD/BcsL family acetyltransferase involved in cellulose biosynthesis